MKWHILTLVAQFTAPCFGSTPSKYPTPSKHLTPPKYPAPSKSPSTHPTPPKYPAPSKSPSPPGHSTKYCYFYFSICYTVDASTPVSKITTSRSTETYDRDYATRYLEASLHETDVFTYTYIKLEGSKTITIPTAASFTPLTDCPITAIPSVYPSSVLCVTTTECFSRPPTNVTVTYTSFIYTGATSTSSVATSTAYAACERAGNILSKFHGQSPLYSFSDMDANDTGMVEYQISALEPRTCCEYAQKYNLTGWSWTVLTGLQICKGFAADWLFFKFVDDPSVQQQQTVLGNGPHGSGVFRTVTPASPRSSGSSKHG